jgi:hypothetical protein
MYSLAKALDSAGRGEEAIAKWAEGARSGMWPSEQQCCVDTTPGLRAKPVWALDEVDAASAAGVRTLLANWRVLAEEAVELVNRGKFALNYDGRNAAGEGSWLAYYLFGDGEKTEHCRRAPRTCALVREAFPDGRFSAKGDTSWFFFSAMNGTVGVVPHCGPSNRNLVLHLGLTVPAGGNYSMSVGGVPLGWAEGEALLFDESFRHTVSATPPPPEQRSADEGSAMRIVFIMRIAHPDLQEG